MAQNNEKSPSEAFDRPEDHDDDHGDDESKDDMIALPAHVVGSGSLDRLVDTACDDAKASTAENTNKAYAADWEHFARWCRLKGTEPSRRRRR